MFILFTFAFMVIIIRLAVISNSDILAQTASMQNKYTLKIAEERGNIYDRNFNKLVNVQENYCAVIMPAENNITQTATEFNRDKNILSKLQSRKPFIIDIENPFLNIPNTAVFKTYRRYTENQQAAHLLGYLNAEHTSGITGIEKAYDDFLVQNKNESHISFPVDGKGQMVRGEIKLIESEENKAGVVLTIDYGIQAIVERIGAETIKKGAIVISDPYSGEIIACASFPSFAPNDLFESVNDVDNTPMINRAFYPFNVGSTFKIPIAAAALEANISQKHTYNCTGKIEINDLTFRCHNRAGHGVLDMKKAMKESCNTYFVSLASAVKSGKVQQTAYDFGYGKSTRFGGDLRSASGYLPSLQELSLPGELANFSFGQGKLLATPIQVNAALCAILNDGKYITPKLIKGTTLDGERYESDVKDIAPITCVKKSTAKTIKEFLIYSVAERAKEVGPNVKVGGKTGTAQTGKFGKDKKEEYTAWFSGFFPAKKPAYAVTVLIENGESGNRVAYPVFSRLADEIVIYEKLNKK